MSSLEMLSGMRNIPLRRAKCAFLKKIYWHNLLLSRNKMFFLYFYSHGKNSLVTNEFLIFV